jgi:hypothetical protein
MEQDCLKGTTRVLNPCTPMKYLTNEQQKVLCVILLLLLTGLAVKTWRTAHPPKHAVTTQAPVSP